MALLSIPSTLDALIVEAAFSWNSLINLPDLCSQLLASRRIIGCVVCHPVPHWPAAGVYCGAQLPTAPFVSLYNTILRGERGSWDRSIAPCQASQNLSEAQAG